MSRRIGIAALIWGASILLSRLIGLVREAVTGRILGGGSDADVFWTAFVVPDFLNHLLAGGALSLVFIPIFGGYLARAQEDRGFEAFSVIANFLMLGLTLLTVVLWFALPSLVPLVAPGFTPAQGDILVALTRIILPAQIFHVLGGLLSAALQARDHHALPALAPLVYTVCIILGGLLGGHDYGAYGFAWGVLVGSALGPFALPLFGLMRTGLRWHPIFRLDHPDLKAYLLKSLPIMFGWSIIFVDDWLLRRFGSMLGAGAISTLQYAKTLMKVPMGVFGLATGVAAFPTLTRLIAQQNHRGAYELLSLAVRRMLVLAFASQAALTAAGPEISRVIYGAKLPPEQHQAIGIALSVMSLALWAWTAQTVVSRGFYALGQTWLPTLLGTGIMVAAYPLYPWLASSMGTLGLAAASSIAVTAYVILLMVILRQRFKGIADAYPAFFARMLISVSCAILLGYYLRGSVPEFHPLLRGTLLGCASMAAFVVVALLVRTQEVADIAKMIQTKRTRSK